MSELLPNLGALLAQLNGDTAGQGDARSLVEATFSAATDEDLDRKLDAVIAAWRKS